MASLKKTVDVFGTARFWLPNSEESLYDFALMARA